MLAYKDVILEEMAKGRDIQIWGIGWLRNKPQARKRYRYWRTGEIKTAEPSRRMTFDPVDKVRELIKSTYPLFQEKTPASKFGVSTDSPSS